MNADVARGAVVLAWLMIFAGLWTLGGLAYALIVGGALALILVLVARSQP